MKKTFCHHHHHHGWLVQNKIISLRLSLRTIYNCSSSRYLLVFLPWKQLSDSKSPRVRAHLTHQGTKTLIILTKSICFGRAVGYGPIPTQSPTRSANIVTILLLLSHLITGSWQWDWSLSLVGKPTQKYHHYITMFRNRCFSLSLLSKMPLYTPWGVWNSSLAVKLLSIGYYF